MRRVMTLVEGRAVEHAGLAAGRHRLRVDERRGHGLFAQHGLSGPRRGFDARAMQMVRGRHVNGLDVGIGHQVGDARVACRAEPPGVVPRRRVRVRHGGQTVADVLEWPAP